ncbi:MAG: hypothetical protein Q9183_004957 [Haloplaca sp. 2 TL-2023]
MRLINTSTFALHKSEELGGPLEYAILSHRWVGAEVTFQDLDSAQWRASNIDKPQMHKIRAACTKARQRNPPLDWLWVDTCCIDKKDLVELSTSLNSMFQWYFGATVCYGYLYDIDWINGQLSKSTNPKRPGQESEWFERGWTLQELLAPRHMEFYDRNWNFMGTKRDLAPMLESETGIAQTYLTGATSFKTASVATKMSWMAGRTTTMVEDIAYSMLGILNINTEIRYGEGINAFMRLQRTLVEHTTDESIFAWETPKAGLSCYRSLGHTPRFDPKEWGLIAPSPDCFSEINDLVVLPNLYVPRLGGGYQWGQQGVTFLMPMSPFSEARNIWGMARKKVMMPLNCWRFGRDGKPYGIVLELVRMGSGTEYRRVQCDVLRTKKGARPADNKFGGLDQVLTVPMTVQQPAFDAFV